MGLKKMGLKKPSQKLRFEVGTQVLCNTDDGWEPGEVTQHWYREKSWPRTMYAPYWVKLDDGLALVVVPQDTDKFVIRREYSWWEREFADPGVDRVAAIRRAAADPELDVSETDFKGSTALTESVRLSWPSCVKALLECGVNVNYQDIKGHSALHYAVTSQGLPPDQVAENVGLLLEGKADPNVQDHNPEPVDGTSRSFEERKEHRAALHYCASWGYLSAARKLLAHGADPNLVDCQYKTPLHVAIDAIDEGDVDEDVARKMVSLLLESKSDPDKGNVEIGMQTSCLMVAARSDDSQLAAALIGAGASLKLTSKQGLTALHIAVRSKNRDVAQALLDAGCDTSVKALGKTAAEMALQSGQPKLAALLGFEGASLQRPQSSPSAAVRQLSEQQRKELFLD